MISTPVNKSSNSSMGDVSETMVSSVPLNAGEILGIQNSVADSHQNTCKDLMTGVNCC